MGRGNGCWARGALPCVLAVAIAALAASPASSAPKQRSKGPKPPPRAFYGTQSLRLTTLGEFEALRAGRVGTLREDFYWPRVERTPGTRRWDYYDFVVGQAARNGIRVLPLLYGTPPHFGASNQAPIHSSQARAAWVSFVGDTVRRYGPGGSFWREYPVIPYLPVTEWQVWNEPNGTPFWYGQPDPWQYADLVKLTSAAIETADSGAKVMLAGLLRKPQEGFGIPMRRFLDRLYRIKGMKRRFDSVAVHPYGQRPSRIQRSLELARRVMTRHGDRNAPLWVTELGWATGGAGDSAIVTSPEDQARKLKSTYRRLLEHRRALKLNGIIWLSLRDYAPPGHSSASWIYHLGLFTQQGPAKPAWPALTQFTRGYPAAIVEPSAPPPSTPPPPPPDPDDPGAPGGPGDPCLLIIIC